MQRPSVKVAKTCFLTIEMPPRRQRDGKYLYFCKRIVIFGSKKSSMVTLPLEYEKCLDSYPLVAERFRHANYFNPRILSSDRNAVSE